LLKRYRPTNFGNRTSLGHDEIGIDDDDDDDDDKVKVKLSLCFKLSITP
jgi:hypothetical protein